MSIACITKDCGRVAFARGLCYSCYGRYAHVVRKGQTTWEALEKAGAAISKAPSSRQAKAETLFGNRKRRGPDRRCLMACGAARRVRGLCLRCYKKAYLDVRERRTTWEELEKAGKALPAISIKEKRAKLFKYINAIRAT